MLEIKGKISTAICYAKIVEDSVTVIDILKPVYNFKASD